MKPLSDTALMALRIMAKTNNNFTPEVVSGLLRTIDDLRSQLTDEKRKYDSADFWRCWVYPKGATPEQIEAELADYHVMIEEVAKVYCHVTDGRISKQLTLASEVISVADDVSNETADQAVKEALSAYTDLRPLDEWHEDIGNVLWWNQPIAEPPYCGTPLDSDWPGYHTHWTRFPVPAEGDGDTAEDSDDDLDRDECDCCAGEGFVEYNDHPELWDEDCPNEINHLVTCPECGGKGTR